MKNATATRRRGVDQRGQHSGAVVAVGFRGIRWSRVQIDRDQRQQQSQKIGEIVSRLGQQGQGVGPDTRHHQQHDVSQRYPERDLENASRAGSAMGMQVHSLKCKGGGGARQERRRAACNGF